MLVSSAISRIKAAGHDISEEYSNEDCIAFLNTAIQQISSLLIAAQYPALVQEVLVRNGDNLPQNYIKCAGTYPIKMTNNKAVIIDDDVEAVAFRYWATPDLITADDTELPYSHDAINEVILKGAVILALNENEYDVTQDSSLMSSLQSAIASAMA
ncbi:MAG: hypothetical protein LUG91_09035 [Ruminococcus sp.]|nr:hypothetical protein [Ruminococcus sp.]